MIELVEPTPPDVARLIADGIGRTNEALAIDRQRFALVSRGNGAIEGGVTVSVSFAVLFIDTLWVDEALRHRGIGTALMLRAEAEGRLRGAELACVDTLSVQAHAFYLKLGYAEFGRVSGHANGLKLDRIWFRKSLLER